MDLDLNCRLLWFILFPKTLLALALSFCNDIPTYQTAIDFYTFFYHEHRWLSPGALRQYKKIWKDLGKHLDLETWARFDYVLGHLDFIWNRSFLVLFVWQICRLLWFNSRQKELEFSDTWELNNQVVNLLLPPTVRPSLICCCLTITFWQRLQLFSAPSFGMQTHPCTWQTNKYRCCLHRR